MRDGAFPVCDKLVPHVSPERRLRVGLCKHVCQGAASVSVTRTELVQ